MNRKRSSTNDLRILSKIFSAELAVAMSRGKTRAWRTSPRQLGPSQGLVSWAAATQKAGKHDHLLDDRQIGIELRIFCQQFLKLGPGMLVEALHAADRQVRMKLPLFSAVAHFFLERVVNCRLKLGDLPAPLCEPQPERSRMVNVGKGAGAATDDLERLDLSGDLGDNAA